MTLVFHAKYSLVNMMNKGFLLAVMSFCMVVPAWAQGNGESDYRYDEALQLWNGTHNASGLTIDSTRNHGYAEFSFQRSAGDYHRVQEGESCNMMQFFTERYQHIGKYLYGYGSFRFSESRTKGKAWSDVMRTFGSNPFICGSAIRGKYDSQSFDFTAKVGTVDFNGWRAGLGLDYKVGDQSRLRDPRSRSRLLDYRIVPSLSFTSGCSTIGMSGWYERRKEKMPTPVTVQNIPNIYYYQMSGLEAVSGTMGGYSGFSREYVNHAFGAELEYGYVGNTWRSVNSISIERAADYIYEQYKREPGRYYNYVYGAKSQNRVVSERMIHQVDISAVFEQGYADEYRPQLIITIDSLTGYKSYRYDNMMTYKKRYQYEAVNAYLHYRANIVKGQSVKSYIGISGALASVSQKHLLPSSSLRVKTLQLDAEYGQALLSSNRLWITLDAGYLFGIKADQSLADMTSDYAQQVLLKDMDYYKADVFHGSASVRYQFPIAVRKLRSLCYVKAFAEILSANNSLNSNTFGVSIGVFN